MSTERKRTYLIDEETGEYTEFIEWREGDILRTKEQREFFFEKMARYADKTDFIWIKFIYNKDFFSHISFENFARLMYFSTFCRSDGFVMHDLDIKSTLNLNGNQVKLFRDEFLGEIIVKDNSRLYLNKKYFGKGKLEETEKNFLRLFTSAMKQLYNSCETTSEHVYLSYFFRMIPFVNRQTNILCRNQEEQEIHHLAYMTITEFLDMIGRTHHARIKAQLQTYRIDDELVIGFFNNPDILTPKGKYAVINPILFYGGDRTKQNYKDIKKLFSDEKEIFLKSKE